MTSVKRRSRLQLRIAVLEACDWRNGLPLTRIAQKAFVNVQECKGILESLVARNYVQKTVSGKRFLYKLTNAGRDFVSQAMALQKGLDDL